MAEENQVQQEPQQVTKEPQRVTMKDPKKAEAGKRLAALNRTKREAKKREEQAQLERGSAKWGPSRTFDSGPTGPMLTPNWVR